MVESVCCVGRGRVGSALAARLAERGLDVRTSGRELDTADAELVLLCVTDRAIPEVAAALEPGPWVAHVSGATALSALDPHVRRFSVHPLQNVVASRGPEQLDGAFAAVTAETEEAERLGFELASLLGLVPFALPDEGRVLYHAGAAIASGFLITLHAAASELLAAAGAPAAALEPLMRGTIANGFQLTGPIVRGDWHVVEAHERAIRETAPHLEELYRVLARATRDLVTGEPL